jgi:hypothetical protein
MGMAGIPLSPFFADETSLWGVGRFLMRVFLLLVLGLLGTGSSWGQLNGGSKAQQVQMHEQKARELIIQKKA